MKSSNITKTILALAFFFFVGTIYADPIDPDEDPDEEEAPLNPAPIGDYIIPMFVVGVVTAFVLLRKKDLMVKNS